MKKKILALLLTISCLFAFSGVVNAVIATNASDGLGSYTLTGPYDFHSGLYASATFNGVKAYCMDPGKVAVKNGTDCSASVYSADNDFAKAAMYIFSSDKSDDLKGTAIRLVAIATGAGAIKYDSSTDDSINARCGYISAAYQAATKSGYGTTKMSGLSGYTSSGGTKCTSWEVNGSVISFAADALKEAKKASTVTAGEKPTATVTTSGGKATIKVDNSKGTKAVTVNISCDANTTGDCGEKTVAAKSVGTFVVKSKVNDSKQCGTFTATMTYEGDSGSGKGCTEITKYSCGAKQDYAGCSKTSSTTNPGGSESKSGKVTEPIKDPSTGTTTIHIKCDEKKKECPYNDDQVNVVADGEGLCDAAGKEVIKVGEAALYTQDVEDCIIDNVKFLVGSSDTGVCKTYCVEDYSFESDGLMLSAQDKDPDTGLITITAGSYFNFANPDAKAFEKGVVKCYTKIDLNTFKSNVEKVAQDTYANNLTSEKHSCSCTTTDGVKSCTDNIVKTTYTAHYTNNKVEFIPNSVTTVQYPSTCDGIKDIVPNADSYKATYEGQVNTLINELKACANDSATRVSYSEECNSKVVFDYGFNVDPIEIKAENQKANDVVTYKAKCNGDYAKCSESRTDAVPVANLDLGTGKAITYPTIEYIEKVSTITADYSLKGVGICNNYNEGTSNSPVSEEACLAQKGTTWVQGWPVSYDTPQNGYKYEITVSDFGHIKAADKCKTLDHYLKGEKVVIGCKYRVNGCEECEWICDPDDPNCEYQECDQDCIWECADVGCIYDSGNGLALNYQPISMINVDSSFAYLSDKYEGVTAVSAGRSAAPKASKLAATATHRSINSVNWGTDKGQATLDVIEDQGETVYEKTPEYKVTLTPKTLRTIKKYNDEQTDGFLNKSLECEIKPENKDMEYVTCTSKFLDDLRNKGILEGTPNFESYKEISNYVVGYDVVSARKSGQGPAWK